MESSSDLTARKHTVGRAAIHFSIGTFLSRISGLAREMAMAFVLGATPSAAAFLAAFRLAHVFRRILGEGALVNSFVPQYQATRIRAPMTGMCFFRDLVHTLSATLLGIIACTEVLLGVCLLYVNLSADTYQLLFLTMLMLPGLWFICLAAVQSGMLQCHGHFFLTGAAPIAFNIAWLGALLLQYNVAPEKAVVGLSVAMNLAFFCHWLLLFPMTYRCVSTTISWRLWWKPDLLSPDIRKLIKTIAISVISVSALQLNSVIDVLFARMAHPAGPAYLAYAMRLFQLPMALCGVAIASAVFPSLARALQAGETAQATSLLHSSFVRIVALTIPATAAIFACGLPAVHLIFGHGKFSVDAVSRTSLCLFAYGIGLFPGAWVSVLNQAFYAQKEYRTPMHTSLFAISINIFLNALFLFLCNQNVTGIAMATSTASIFQAVVLTVRYRRFEKMFLWRTHRLFLMQATVCSGCAYLGMRLLSVLGAPFLPQSACLVDRLLRLMMPAGLFFLLLYLSCCMLRVHPMRVIRQ